MTMTASPIVGIAGLNKWFGDFHVLRDIDLDVGKGERIVICGPSGSGKSTFLRCINHLEKINSGRLSVDGELVGYREGDGKLYELREDVIARKRSSYSLPPDSR